MTVLFGGFAGEGEGGHDKRASLGKGWSGPGGVSAIRSVLEREEVRSAIMVYGMLPSQHVSKADQEKAWIRRGQALLRYRSCVPFGAGTLASM